MSKASKKPSTLTAKQRSKQQASSVKSDPTVVLPGYIRFTKDVFSRLTKHRGVFLRLLVLTWVVAFLVVGLAQQTYYSDLSQSTDEVTGQLSGGVYKTMIEVGALFISIASGVLSGSLTETQQIYISAVYLLLWLTVVWLLRHLLSKSEVNLRDALYNAAAPTVSTMLVMLVGLLQLLPFALVVALVAALASSGVLGGVLWGLLGLLLMLVVGALSLYWLAGTVFAAVVVTIPGTYPWAALRSARQLIAGHRGKVLLRLLWLGLVVLLAMLVTMLPVILVDALVGYQLSLLVVLALQFVSVAIFIYSAAYVYLLYRGVIDERS